eukprot:jgi/Orpsp1_1/1182759/evm.model.c7180000082571.1
MIIIAFLLSILIEYLLRDLIKTEKYEYCTNEYNSAFVLPNGVDEFKQDDPEVHIKHYTSADTPCSSWFGSNDYFESYPYDILPENNEANINRDTTFMPSIDKTNKKGNYEYILSNINKFMGKGLLNVFVVLNEMGTYHNDAEQKEYYNKKFYEYKKKKEKEDAKKLEDMNNNNNNNDNDNNNNNDNDNNNSSSTSKLHKRADLSSLLNISPEMLNTISNIKYISDNVIRPWAFVAINKNNATDHKAIGQRQEGPSNITVETINTDKYDLTNQGYLDYTYTRYGMNLAPINQLVNQLQSSFKLDMSTISKLMSLKFTFERLPYFETLEVEDDHEVDDLITQRMK